MLYYAKLNASWKFRKIGTHSAYMHLRWCIFSKTNWYKNVIGITHALYIFFETTAKITYSRGKWLPAIHMIRKSLISTLLQSKHMLNLANLMHSKISCWTAQSKIRLRKWIVFLHKFIINSTTLTKEQRVSTNLYRF